MNPLKSKVALITGAGRGIGRCTAEALAREGCQLVICSRSVDELEAVAQVCRNLGVDVLPLVVDLMDVSAVEKLVGATLERFGRVDILINNAGIIIPRPLLEITLEEWDQTLNLNLRSLFLLSQRVLAEMAKHRRGYIINISSTVALSVPPHLASYGASKTGVAGFNQALYETAKEYGVKVSCVYPGITDTKMVRDIEPPTRPDQWMQPEDITDCILFLLKTSPRVVIKDLVPWSVGYDRV